MLGEVTVNMATDRAAVFAALDSGGGLNRNCHIRP
jgi:hypothetical protein